MKLIDLAQEEAWAIRPEVLDTIHAVLASKFHGDVPDIAGIEARIGRPLDNTRSEEMDIRDGIAVIPVRGVLAKRMNIMMQISGGTSMEILKQDISAVLDDRSVDAIILDVDSPGGTVAGTMELATWLRAQRGRKPIRAFANETMASGAYWIASSADDISAQATAQIGSIGVLTAHYDYSQYDAKAGVKRTFLHAGRYKAIGNDAEPLSQEGRDYIQERLDQLYTLFVDGVAVNRGVDAGKVLSDMADGKIFLAQQAKEVGLIDNIMGSLDDMVAATKEALRMSMTVEKLRAEHPEIVAALNTEWINEQVAATDADKAVAVKAAVDAARTDVLRLHAAVFGDETSRKFEALVNSGVTVEQLAATVGLIGKSGTQSELIGALQQTSPPAINDPKKPVKAVDIESFMDKVNAYKAEKGCDTTTAMSVCVRKYPDLHAAFLGRKEE